MLSGGKLARLVTMEVYEGDAAGVAIMGKRVAFPHMLGMYTRIAARAAGVATRDNYWRQWVEKRIGAADLSEL